MAVPQNVPAFFCHLQGDMREKIIKLLYYSLWGDRGSTVVKVLCYKSEGRWFDPSWCQWIFH